jgi:uracil-DNA glycosylase
MPSPPAANPTPPAALPEMEAPPAFDSVPAEAYDDPSLHAPEDDIDFDLPDATPRVPAIDGLDWAALAQRVAGCRECALCESRSNTVFGIGDRQARLMIVGEAPGGDEDRQGEPFVGRAGQLLNAMLRAIGFAREQVYIANVLKCRPPGNRDPQLAEVAACQPYLNRQIALIAPTLILSVGGVSAKNLLNTDESVGRLRGRMHRYPATDTPLMVTYHPAYLLRRPSEKAKVWQDLQQVHRYLQQQAST